MEGNLNELRRKLDGVKGKLEVALGTIKDQKEEIEALHETSITNGNLVVKYENAIKKSIFHVDVCLTDECDADTALNYIFKELKNAVAK